MFFGNPTLPMGFIPGESLYPQTEMTSYPHQKQHCQHQHRQPNPAVQPFQLTAPHLWATGFYPQVTNNIQHPLPPPVKPESLVPRSWVSHVPETHVQSQNTMLENPMGSSHDSNKGQDVMPTIPFQAANINNPTGYYPSNVPQGLPAPDSPLLTGEERPPWSLDPSLQPPLFFSMDNTYSPTTPENTPDGLPFSLVHDTKDLSLGPHTFDHSTHNAYPWINGTPDTSARSGSSFGSMNVEYYTGDSYMSQQHGQTQAAMSPYVDVKYEQQQSVREITVSPEEIFPHHASPDLASQEHHGAFSIVDSRNPNNNNTSSAEDRGIQPTPRRKALPGSNPSHWAQILPNTHPGPSSGADNTVKQASSESPQPTQKPKRKQKQKEKQKEKQKPRALLPATEKKPKRTITLRCPYKVSDMTPRDQFLVQNKLEGKTYKEIKVAGNFAEAESTLRGRFRTLTKAKEARVRKPDWSEKDVKLLAKAVRKYKKGKKTKIVKVPWKKVAEYIVRNGGSYHFGNATCRKKWDELEGSS